MRLPKEWQRLPKADQSECGAETLKTPTLGAHRINGQRPCAKYDLWFNRVELINQFNLTSNSKHRFTTSFLGGRCRKAVLGVWPYLCIRAHSMCGPSQSEPVWPSGKAALGWTAEGPRFESPSVLLSLQKLWSVDTVLWLRPSRINETLRQLSSLPILVQESFWWWQCSQLGIIIISLFPHLHTPFAPRP